jgi:hypothetical protein
MFNKVEVKVKKGKKVKAPRKITPRALRTSNRIKKIKVRFENKRLVYKAKIRKLRAEHRKELAKQKHNLRVKRKIIRQRSKQLRMVDKLATKLIKIINVSNVETIIPTSAKAKKTK